MKHVVIIKLEDGEMKIYSLIPSFEKFFRVEDFIYKCFLY